MAEGEAPPAEPHRRARGDAYHYTTGAGLLGILTERRIRLTDVRFLNDRNELAGRELLARVLEQTSPWSILSALKTHPDMDPKLAVSIESIARAIGEYGRHGGLEHRAFVACFCANGDLLSQWRGYAAQGTGYSIGFDWDKINLKRLDTPAEWEQADEPGTEPGMWWFDQIKVTYGTDRQLATYVEDLAKWVSDEIGWLVGSKAIAKLLGRKDKAFKEEKERRLVAIWSSATPPQLRFRDSERGLVPYVDAPFAVDAITDVVIGPTLPPEADVAVRDLLRMSLGRDAADKIEVRRSAAPYR
jgi:hypothetical protein